MWAGGTGRTRSQCNSYPWFPTHPFVHTHRRNGKITKDSLRGVIVGRSMGGKGRRVGAWSVRDIKF